MDVLSSKNSYIDAIKLLNRFPLTAQHNRCLLLAAKNGHVDAAVKSFLTVKVDPNADVSGSAITAASVCSYLEIVELLLELERIQPHTMDCFIPSGQKGYTGIVK